MKLIKSPEKAPEFKPFDLTLRIESLEDAKKLMFIFNSTKIVQGLDIDSVAREVRSFLDETTPKISIEDNFWEYSKKVFKN